MSFANTTLATLQTRLAERYDQQVFWTADSARRAINEGIRTWNLLTGTWRAASVGLTTIPNDPYLFVGGTVEKVTRVSMGPRVLNPSSLDQLDHLLPGWEGQTTASGSIIPTTPRYWAPVGLTAIAIFPADATVLTSPITVDGVTAAPILINAGDFLDLGDEEINTLLGYALHVLCFAKGIAALQATRPLYIAFLKAAATRNAVFAASSLYRKLIGIDALRYAIPLKDQTAAATAEALATAQDDSTSGGTP